MLGSLGASGGVGVSGVYWGLAGTLGTWARRGIGASGILGAARGCWGHYGHQRASGGCRDVRGVLGAGRECRYSGA